MPRDGITKARMVGAAAVVAVVVVFALGLLSVLTAHPDVAQAAETATSGSTATPATPDPAIGTGSPATPAAPSAAPSPPAKANTMLATLAQLGPASRAAQAKALSLPETGMGSLARGPGGTIRVEIRTTHTSADVQAMLVALGAQIVHVSTTYSTITADIPNSAITAITSAPFVVAATPVLLPAVSKATSEAIGSSTVGPSASTPAPCDVLDSQANSQLRATLARSTHSVDGAGVTIGVLSDSFSRTSSPTTAAQDVASGALPGPSSLSCGYTTPVNVVADYTGAATVEDEGRAMLQLVHSVAPAAHLAFATAFESETSFADNIIALKDAGATVIVDDITYPYEPMFQEGPVASAVTAATNAGVTYLSSAGNNNLILAGKNIASWEAPAFRPMACPSMSPAPPGPGDCMDFNPSAGTDSGAGYTVAPLQVVKVDLQWSEPMYGVTTDLDLYLIDSSTGEVLGTSDYAIGDVPVEVVGWKNGSAARNVEVVIRRYGNTGTPRVKFNLLENGAAAFTYAQYNASSGGDVVGPTIFGHNGGVNTISTAAIDYSSTTSPETYSSRGPVTLHWNPVSGTAIASALSSPMVLQRPDITATDGDCTTFFYHIYPTYLGPSCPYRFAGTSAAAPNAAGVVALMRQKNPTASPATLRTALVGSASALSGGSVYASGAGLVDAAAAVATVAAHAPGPPTAVLVTAGDSTAAVSWTTPTSDGGSPITDYTATATPGAKTCTVSGTPPATGCTITGLTNGQAYTITVTAHNGAGDSAASDPTTTTPFTVPNPPTGLGATPGSGTATLTWTAPASDGGSPITDYTATATPGAKTCTVSGTPPATGCTITGLTNGQAYTITVTAHNTAGDSAASATTSTTPRTTPGPPELINTTPEISSIEVSWTAPASDGGSPITSYTATATPGAKTCTVSGTPPATGCTITGVSPDVAYTITVSATNEVGGGTPSAPSTPITPKAPQAPSQVLAVVALAGNGVAGVYWTAPTSDGGSPIVSYTVTASPGGASCLATGAPPATNCTIGGLINGQAYTFTVIASNAIGSAAPSTQSAPVVPAAPIPPNTIPGAPRIVKLKVGKKLIKVWFRASTNGGVPIDAYQVRCKGPKVRTALGSRGPISVKILKSGKYRCSVVAHNAIGWSPFTPWSGKVTVKS